MSKVSIELPGFISLLTLIFVVAKILGEITWSWWWVFSPIWIPISVVLAILITIFIISVIVEAFK